MTLPEWQDIHLPEAGRVLKQDLSPLRAFGVSLSSGLCFWHGGEVRVTGVNIQQKHNLALENTVGSYYVLLNTFCVLGSLCK